MSTSTTDPILRVEGLSKSYQEVVALEGVSFEVSRNSITGLVGDNGAGKSTLLKVLNGFVQPDDGEIYLDGDRFAPENPQDAREAGIAMTYEEFAVVNQASVWENFFMGRELANSYGPLKTVRRNDMRAEVAEKLREYGFNFGVDKDPSELSGGQRRILVVSRAIESDPDLLLLDEPFRGLSERAIDQLWEILHEFARDGSVLITGQWYSSIEGNVDDVMILRQGEKVGQFTSDTVDRQTCNRLMMEGRA